jgi:tetratricopeptide (TPR) repeat protein
MSNSLDNQSEKEKYVETQLENLEEKMMQRIHAAELEIASRRNQEKVVVYLGYAAIAAGVIIGLFGISEISDIDNTVNTSISQKTAEIDERLKAVDTQVEVAERRLESSIVRFDRDLDLRIDNKVASYVDISEDRLRDFRELGDRINKLFETLKAAEEKWSEIIEPKLLGLEEEDPDADLKGRYLKVLVESERPGIEWDDDWRIRATSVILRATDQLSRTSQDPNFIPQFSPNDLFNIAQLAKQLDRFDLERNFVEAAHNADEGAASRALQLQSDARYSTGDQKEEAFKELMDMVRNLSLDAPQIVVAEAWNAAEALRRYGDLISSIDDLIEKNSSDSSVFLPSHVFAIRGNAYQRRGLPGDLDEAAESYRLAVERFEEEGLLTQWAHATIRNTSQYLDQLRRSGIDTSEMDEAIKRSSTDSFDNGAVMNMEDFLRSLNDLDLPDLNDTQEFDDAM